jgi:integrase/recombinase XerC
MNQLVPICSLTLPMLVAGAGERASMRFLEFFAADIRSPHTCRTYAQANDHRALSGGDNVADLPVIARRNAHVAGWRYLSAEWLP